MSRSITKALSVFFVFFFKSEYNHHDNFISLQSKMKVHDKKHIPLISIKDMTRGYPDSKRQLFQKFNFTLEKGDFIVVTGKSGSGKSTLVKFLIGQLRPYKKTVFYKMEDLAEFGDSEIQRYRRKI